jgi:hypothetical protein
MALGWRRAGGPAGNSPRRKPWVRRQWNARSPGGAALGARRSRQCQQMCRPSGAFKSRGAVYHGLTPVATNCRRSAAPETEHGASRFPRLAPWAQGLRRLAAEDIRRVAAAVNPGGRAGLRPKRPTCASPGQAQRRPGYDVRNAREALKGRDEPAGQQIVTDAAPNPNRRAPLGLDSASRDCIPRPLAWAGAGCPVGAHIAAWPRFFPLLVGWALATRKWHAHGVSTA